MALPICLLTSGMRRAKTLLTGGLSTWAMGNGQRHTAFRTLRSTLFCILPRIRMVLWREILLLRHKQLLGTFSRHYQPLVLYFFLASNSHGY